MTATNDRFLILIGWASMTGFEPTGRHRDRYGLEPEFRAAWEFKRVCWLRRGTAKDLAKACLYAEQQGPGYHVLCSPAGTKFEVAEAELRALVMGSLPVDEAGKARKVVRSPKGIDA